MKTINAKNYIQEILSCTGPVIVEFYKPEGCSNCAQMKPVLANFEKRYPHVTILGFACKDGSEVPKEFQFRTFPGLFSFIGGNPIRAFSGFKTMEQMDMIFNNDRDIKADLYTLPKRVAFLEKELEEYNRDAAVIEALVLEPVEKVKGLPRKDKS